MRSLSAQINNQTKFSVKRTYIDIYLSIEMNCIMRSISAQKKIMK